MWNKKLCSHSVSKQQASISWPFPCAINRSFLLSIKIMSNYSKVSKDLKPCFPLVLHCCCVSPVDMTQKMVRFSPSSSVFHSHLSSYPFTSQTLDPLPMSGINLQPSLVCFLALPSGTTQFCTYRAFLLVLIFHLFFTLIYNKCDNASY